MTDPAFDSGVPLLWTCSPGGAVCSIQTLAVADDGGTVVAGTYCGQPGLWAEQAESRPPMPVVQSVYCLNGDGGVRWRDAVTGWTGVCSVAVSGNGRFVAAGGEYQEEAPQGFVRAYDADSGAVLLKHRTVRRVNQVALSRDGLWLVAAAERVEVFCRVLDTDGFSKVGDYAPDERAGAVINAVGLADDGTTIVWQAADGRVGVLSNSGGMLVPLKEFDLPDGESFRVLAVATDGGQFVVGSSAGWVRCFETSAFLRTGQPIWARRVAEGEQVAALAIAEPMGQVVVAVQAGEGGTVQRWAGESDGTVATRAERRLAGSPQNLIWHGASESIVAVEGGGGAVASWPVNEATTAGGQTGWRRELPESGSSALAVAREAGVLVMDVGGGAVACFSN
ncbi:WD40 repeat domain-containing protein [Actomonas aquatica]|uniref:Anaphase-promoting complex subunit 4 WD40 domain-containing protein n=1 Tax=Actomonas aquatica TaxID=2866162 RepID=A0ABZ1CEZ0_9BACT|nr:hypothetical protein [Opitutus sp. WL0086]WRQ90063.1 hypothetical protein K1X11_011645 [Opitutus sp. WL0086]